VSVTYLILAEGFSADPHYGKTMRGVLRYRRADVAAVLDSTRAAGDTEEGAPVVRTVAEGVERGADTALVGVATQGGRFPPAWRGLLRECVEHGLGCVHRLALLESGVIRDADTGQLREFLAA
jgi:uncharacterized NAD-dependent epimerase/dehydratase family protein